MDWQECLRATVSAYLKCVQHLAYETVDQVQENDDLLTLYIQVVHFLPRRILDKENPEPTLDWMQDLANRAVTQLPPQLCSLSIKSTS